MRREMLALLLLGCGGPEEPDPNEEATTPPTTTLPDPVLGLQVLPKLAGLWSGTASQTPLGTFPMMNVDFRAMNDGLLWGRVDLDPDNALRFGLEVEARQPDQLVYRNGGFFAGMLRDDRTLLMEHDAAEERWRFCHESLGCDYIDAVYDFDGPDSLLFDVKVRAEQHVYWTATRLEERSLPDGFPSGDAAAPDAPLLDMPEARVTVSWSTPLAEEADVWVVFTVEACTLGSGCPISRSTRVVVPAGATTAEAVMPEIHAGPYKAAAVLDRDRNLAATFIPGPQDGVSLPNRDIEVGPTGVTQVQLTIVLGA